MFRFFFLELQPEVTWQCDVFTTRWGDNHQLRKQINAGFFLQWYQSVISLPLQDELDPLSDLVEKEQNKIFWQLIPKYEHSEQWICNNRDTIRSLNGTLKPQTVLLCVNNISCTWKQRKQWSRLMTASNLLCIKKTNKKTNTNYYCSVKGLLRF